MLFLSHKLDIALSRARVMNEEKYKSVQESYREWLENTAKRWMKQCNSLPADAEVGDILNIVEGIHATRRLGLTDDNDVDDDDDDDNLDQAEQREAKKGRKQRSASKKAQELLRVVRMMERNHDNGGRKRKKKRRKLQDFGGGTRVFDTSRYKDNNSKVRVSEIASVLSFHHVTDVVGCDPTRSNGFPMTPQNHCSNCAVRNRRGMRECSNCECYLFCSVDWGALTDACVWLYVCTLLVHLSRNYQCSIQYIYQIRFRGHLTATSMSRIGKSKSVSYISIILEKSPLSSTSLLYS